MLEKYYPIHSASELNKFLEKYIPMVRNQLDMYGIKPDEYGIKGDHLGLQTLSPEEFDAIHSHLIEFSDLIKEGTIHNRRNNLYKLHDFIETNGIELQSIEIFEPKPDAIISKLKPGVEHIALKVDKYEKLLTFFQSNSLPIDKIIEYEGSKLFKTKLINLVEIEFRNDYLWETLQE
jgi:hypothetical protein